MFADQTRTVLILPQALLDRARVFAGEATSQLKRMVSLQMVLRALIDEGLKQDGGRAVLATLRGRPKRFAGFGAGWHGRGGSREHQRVPRSRGHGGVGIREPQGNKMWATPGGRSGTTHLQRGWGSGAAGLRMAPM
jgi:hypothetical protein